MYVFYKVGTGFREDNVEGKVQFEQRKLILAKKPQELVIHNLLRPKVTLLLGV